MTRSTLFLILGQSALFVGLCACFVINPHFIGSNEGVSNYGVHLRTIVPYGLGFLVAGVTTLAAGRYMPRGLTTARYLAASLYVLGAIFLAVLLSTYPYQLSEPFRIAHVGVGALLYFFELLVAVWLTFFIHKDTWAGLLFGVFIAGALTSLTSFINLTGFFIAAQLLTGLGFSLLIIRGTHAISNRAASVAGGDNASQA